MNNMESVVLNNIKNAHINLCVNCSYHYPECPANAQDVLFGNFDNVCACAEYTTEDRTMNSQECNNTIQYENGKWIPAEPIPYYPPKKRSFKEIMVSTIKILKGKEGVRN